MCYIKAYEEVLPREYCEELIQKHNRNQELLRMENKLFQFNQSTMDKSDICQLFSFLNPLLKLYIRNTGIRQYQFPEQYDIEIPRIKMYRSSSDHFSDHVDVVDKETCKRFLSFLVYLNTTDGGETEFFTSISGSGNIKIQPVAGTVVVFPPLWTYPHKAHPTNSGEKYILSTYLQYR